MGRLFLVVTFATLAGLTWLCWSSVPHKPSWRPPVRQPAAPALPVSEPDPVSAQPTVASAAADGAKQAPAPPTNADPGPAILSQPVRAAAAATTNWPARHARRSAEARRVEALRVLRVDPHHPLALREAATAQVELARWSDAADTLARLLEREPDNPQAWIDYATALSHAGRLTAAADAWTRCTVLLPESTEAWHNRAVFEQAVGRLRLARESADVVIKLSPQRAASWQLRASILSELGPKQDALQDYRAAAGCADATDEVVLALAEALVLAQRPGEAIQALHDSLSLRGAVGPRVILLAELLLMYPSAASPPIIASAQAALDRMHAHAGGSARLTELRDALRLKNR